MEIPNVNTYEEMGGLISKNNDEYLKKNLIERKRIAINGARAIDEINDKDEEDAKNMNDFIYGRIDLAQFNEKDTRKENFLFENGELGLRDIEEMFHFLNDLLKDSELANELASHEKEHLDKIIAVGWSAKIVFRFFINKNGMLSGRPGVIPIIPKNEEEKSIRKKLKAIINVADELSDMDNLATKK